MAIPIPFSTCHPPNASPPYSGECTFNVVVLDKEAPKITCRDDMEIETEAGSALGQASFAPPTVSDNSKEAVSVSCDPSSPAKVSIGVSTVTCTAIDKSGNEAECSFSITTLDKEAPKLTCDAERTGVTHPNKATGELLNSQLPVATDNSG